MAGVAVRRADAEEKIATVGYHATALAAAKRGASMGHVERRRQWRRWHWPAAFVLLTSALAARAMAGPTLQGIQDVVIKACGDPLVRNMACPAASSCQDGEAQLVLGHTDPTLTASLIVSIQRVTPAIADPLSSLRDVVVRTVSGQKVVSVCPKGKLAGRTVVYLKITDGNGQFILSDFAVVIQPLMPVFDDAGPTRCVPVLFLPFNHVRVACVYVDHHFQPLFLTCAGHWWTSAPFWQRQPIHTPFLLGTRTRTWCTDCE